MKFKVSITGGTPGEGLTIEPGESVELPLTWKNSDGSARSSTGAAFSAKVYDANGAEVTGTPATVSSGGLKLIVAAASTAPWSGTYRVKIYEVRSGDTPPSTGIASFNLNVQFAAN